MALIDGPPAAAELTRESLLVVPDDYEEVADPELHVYNTLPDGGDLLGPEALTPCEEVEVWERCLIGSAALSPDGSEIAMLLVEQDYDYDPWRERTSIVTMSTNGTDRQVLNEETRVISEDYPGVSIVHSTSPIEYSPDGFSLLVYAGESHADGTYDQFFLSLDVRTGERDIVVSRPYLEGEIAEASWTPDGSAIVYTQYDEQGASDGFVFVTPQGDRVRTIRPAMDASGYPRVSPDGTMLAFLGSDAVNGGQLYIMDLASEAVRKLTSTDYDPLFPEWTRDGKTLLYVETRHEDPTELPVSALVRIPAEGGTPQTLLSDDAALSSTRTLSDTYGDLRPPGQAHNFDGLLDGATSEAHLRWDPALDPRSEDGARGSGVAGYLVRYRRDGGSWSTQEFVAEPEVVVAGSHTGEEIEVEVSAQDAANNIGDAAIETVEVAAPTTGDFDAPALSSGGELADRGGGYVGPEQLQLAVGAEDDEGDGVARLSVLAEDGQQLATSQVDCSSGCPTETEHTFSVNTAALAEGPTTLRVRAEDQSNNRDVAEALDVYVDHTAPAAPDDVVVGDFDASTGIATVDWNDGSDPELGAGLPGSGDGGAVFRYQVGGVWSSWEAADDGSADVPGLVPDQSFAVQVKSKDSVGNDSPVVSANLSAEPDDGSAVEDDAHYLSQRSEVLSAEGGLDEDEEGAEAAQFTNCQPLLNRVFTTNHGPAHTAFVPAFTQVETRLRMYCHSIDSRFEKVRVKAVAFVKTGSGTDIEDDFKQLFTLDSGPAFDATFNVRDHSLAYSGFVGPKFDCTPSLGGPRKYLVAGWIKYVDNHGPDSKWKYWDTGRGGIGPGPQTATCPTARIRRERELAGWIYQKVRSPDGQHRSTGRQELKAELPSPPWKPPGTKWAWAAHHIVPLNEAGADPMRALMYRCHIHPNEATNGVWLRNVGLRSDKPAYDELVEYDYNHNTTYHWRTYHYDTRFASYVSILRYDYLQTHLKQNRETCPIENRSSVRTSVDAAADQLKVGEFGMETNR